MGAQESKTNTGWIRVQSEDFHIWESLEEFRRYFDYNMVMEWERKYIKLDDLLLQLFPNNEDNNSILEDEVGGSGASTVQSSVIEPDFSQFNNRKQEGNKI